MSQSKDPAFFRVSECGDYGILVLGNGCKIENLPSKEYALLVVGITFERGLITSAEENMIAEQIEYSTLSEQTWEHLVLVPDSAEQAVDDLYVAVYKKCRPSNDVIRNN